MYQKVQTSDEFTIQQVWDFPLQQGNWQHCCAGITDLAQWGLHINV